MATIALLSWPLIALGLFYGLGTGRGLIWSTLIGYLFLPPNFGFDLPGLPPYTKHTAIALASLLGCLVTQKRATFPRESLLPGVSKLITFFAIIIIFSPALTVLTNREPLAGGALPGLGARDIISMMSDSLLMLVPFFLARRFLNSVELHRELLLAIVIGTFIYSFAILFEARMSPQLNQWIYGYFQHVWAQHIRGGGWRPIVFLNHGLEVGFVVFSGVIAALVLFRLDQGKRHHKYILLAAWFLLVLPISRNLGATILVFLLAPVALMFGRRLQIIVVTSVALLFLTFPLTRQADIFPTDRVLAFAESISPERASSLAYRVENENAFLQRALEKPAFGWGIWARWRIFDEDGRDTSTSDGQWVSVLGERGWVGYLSLFGLVCLPLLLLSRTMRHRPLSAPTRGMAIIMAGNLIYLIPNAGISPISWLMIGALVRFVERRPLDIGKPDPDTPLEQGASRPTSRYTRFPDGLEPNTSLRRIS